MSLLTPPTERVVGVAKFFSQSASIRLLDTLEPLSHRIPGRVARWRGEDVVAQGTLYADHVGRHVVYSSAVDLEQVARAEADSAQFGVVKGVESALLEQGAQIADFDARLRAVVFGEAVQVADHGLHEAQVLARRGCIGTADDFGEDEDDGGKVLVQENPVEDVRLVGKR